MRRKTRYNIYFAIWITIFAFLGWRALDAVFLGEDRTQELQVSVEDDNEEIDSNQEEDNKNEENNGNQGDNTDVDTTKRVFYDVPFTAQAPLGEWSDPRQQDGCEEAAAFMAISWARGETFTLQQAKNEIISASKHTETKYGEFRDTSAMDTFNWIIKDYFDFRDARIEYGITTEDIKDELYNGKLVIIPTDGRKLQNPYFTPPGPERHMFVINGYDPATKEFIANDNGTRYGKSYRYKESIIADAMMDYPTGYHEPIANHHTAMIVISKP